MACPFFSPTHRADDLPFPHPSRLPLQAGWRGVCAAPGHERAVPSDPELQSCNLGYARSCPRFPKSADAEGVRFGVLRESAESVTIQYVFELAHRPGSHGVLEYDRRLSAWPVRHPNPLVQNLAEAFLRSYLERKTSTLTLSE